MSTRFHLADMAKGQIGKVAKNISRAGRMASFSSFGSYHKRAKELVKL